MKRGILIIASLLLVCSAFAFDTGSMLIGGQAGFSYTKMSSDEDASSDFYLFPQFGYFINPNTCIDGILKFELMGGETMDVTAIGIGAGARHFFNQLYVGVDLQYQTAEIDVNGLDRTESGLYGTLKTGYLYPLFQGVYVDSQIRYVMGLGDYGGDITGENEMSAFNLLLGLQIELSR